jgi:transposase-like protein
MSAPDATPRVQPFYCPYCGEQDIRPSVHEGAFHCAVCDRVWSLEYRGPAGPEERG